jgi:hypothetical protein
MRPDDVRHLLWQQPFEPFRIILLDGTTYDIRDPDLVLLERSAVKIGHPASKLPLRLSHREVRMEPIE